MLHYWKSISGSFIFGSNLSDDNNNENTKQDREILLVLDGRQVTLPARATSLKVFRGAGRKSIESIFPLVTFPIPFTVALYIIREDIAFLAEITMNS